MLPFSTWTTGAGNIGGGGVILRGTEEVEEVLDEGGPGGMSNGGGVEQQPPQLLQDRGAAALLALPYGFMAARLLFNTIVNSGTKSIQGPWTETGGPGPQGRKGDQRIDLQIPPNNFL